MRYMGSKNRLAEELAPIIQSYITDETKGYLEPFVGGANMIDKIKCENRIGYDSHKQLIALFKKLQTNKDEIPDEIPFAEYERVKNNKNDYEDWYLGLVGFLGSFGAKYFDGYARNHKNDSTGQIQRGSIKSLKKQYESLKNVKFECKDFREIDDDICNYVIYCDPPYKNTKKYSTKNFPYDEFYDWCKEMSKNNIVLISEYSMPDDFECIWEQEVKVNFDSNRKKQKDLKNKRIEKLFIFKGDE